MYGPESRPQIFRCAERPALVEVPLKKMVRRARNMSGHRIHRFDLAAIALRRPRVDAAASPHRSDAHRHRSRCRPSCPCRGAAMKHGRYIRASSDRADTGRPLRDPFGQAAIEYRDGVMAKPAQQPPQPAREHAVVLIVGDDLLSAGDAEAAERRRGQPAISGSGWRPFVPVFGPDRSRSRCAYAAPGM